MFEIFMLLRGQKIEQLHIIRWVIRSLENFKGNHNKRVEINRLLTKYNENIIYTIKTEVHAMKRDLS